MVIRRQIQCFFHIAPPGSDASSPNFALPAHGAFSAAAGGRSGRGRGRRMSPD